MESLAGLILVVGLLLGAIKGLGELVRPQKGNRRRGNRNYRRRNHHGWVPRGGPDPVEHPIQQPSQSDLHREQRAAARGEAGEKELFGILRHRLASDVYEVLADIMLPDGKGGTTQVDFIVVSEYGIFVIEAKNYSGWIFARKGDKVWTQSLAGGMRNTFHNPIHQNWAHICALESNAGIPKSVMFPMVAFSDRADFKTNIPDGVCYFSDVVGIIRSKTAPLVKAEQISEIVDAILAWDQSISPEQRAAHVANLRARHKRKPQ